jgi:hypothetical protein
LTEQLSKYFKGAVAKYLSSVDADPEVSNQHEIGTNRLKKFLGDPGGEKQEIPAVLIFLDQDEENSIRVESKLTWYNSRHGKDRSAEFRLYYIDNPVTDRMVPGDFLIIAVRKNNELLLIVTKPETSTEQRLKWLFGIDDVSNEYSLCEVPEGRKVSFAERFILEELGIETTPSDGNALELLLQSFGEEFPTTRNFSAFARKFSKINRAENPDSTLMAWMETEENLFRIFEKHLVEDKIKDGFRTVDDFVSFSLSVHNRRKSRVGFALENHLEEVFRLSDVRCSRGKVTENKSKPDFLFPGITEYQASNFPFERLTMLGAKSTCKDRWRQVLSEAEKVKHKHLLTLEPSISEQQTKEMQFNNLSLVIPSSLHNTYKPSQRNWLTSLSGFVDLVKKRQIG